jgi:hypothetical protein
MPIDQPSQINSVKVKRASKIAKKKKRSRKRRRKKRSREGEEMTSNLLIWKIWILLTTQTS